MELSGMAAQAVPIYKNVTLEEILALRHVWITLRHQWGNCLSPDQGRVLNHW